MYAALLYQYLTCISDHVFYRYGSDSGISRQKTEVTYPVMRYLLDNRLSLLETNVLAIDIGEEPEVIYQGRTNRQGKSVVKLFQRRRSSSKGPET
jgi:hypothetical protein